MKTLLQNIHTLVTCDDEDRILHGTDLLLDGGAVAAIAPGLDAPDARVIDGRALLVYPGLVNTHHHLYQYFTRNLPEVQGMELFDWLTALYGIWANLDADAVYQSSLAGMAELMRFGCTTCFDHHYVFPAGQTGLIDAQFEAAAALGIRLHASRGSMSLSKKDGGLPPDSVVQETDAILADSRRLIETYHDPSPLSMRQVVLAPCSPFSVTADLLRESAALARAYGVRLHTHLCETKDEERFTLARTGLRPFAYMESLGWVGPDVFYAHGIHFNDAELAALAETGTGVAHCPCSNMKLSSGVMRLPEMLRLGVPVGLAVDGSASNDASNLLEEIRTAYLLHRLTAGDAAPTGYELLRLATRGGARLLGREDIGRLAVGCAADLFAIRMDRPELLCASRDAANLFGTVGCHRAADYVFVAGRLTVEHGALLTVDEERLQRDGAAACRRLLARA